VTTHKYQAKETLVVCQIPTPRERAAFRPSEAMAPACELGIPLVVKAQVLVGCRDEASGLRQVERLLL